VRRRSLDYCEKGELVGEEVVVTGEEEVSLWE